jgi:oxygen-dependent protoporphyrinogen oxidase
MRRNRQEARSQDFDFVIGSSGMSPASSTASPFPTALPIAVLGAGITGLSAAWHLQRSGASIALFETSGRVGGVIESIRRDGWLHEAGPNSVLEGPPEAEKMIEALGLGPRRLYAGDAAKNRYVVRRGQLEPMPTSLAAFLRSQLFSLRAKLRIASEIFRPRGMRSEKETVAEFTLRRLGREFLDYAIDPFVGGVYAGDPFRLSVRHAFPKLLALEMKHGSLLRGAIRKRNASGGPSGKLFSFPDGLEELPRAMAESLGGSLRLQTRIHEVRRLDAEWRIAYERGGETREECFSAVICALPGDALATLKFEGYDNAGGLCVMSEIEHPPVASVFTGFRREDVSHALDGFGVLVPRAEGRNILGTLFSSTLFSGRAPADHVALTTFVGGARQPALGRLDDRAVTKLVQAELATLLGVRAAPVFVSVRRHARAIPQYTVGYDRYQASCANAEASALGLYIGGNCRDGVSVSACLASGRRLALAAVPGAPAKPACVVN